ncbi:MAG: LON peptidase substrate-binding domain-containing protein [Candidatus Poribacteria bacterium]|nr:LON peptidase substrate-binding domain-containing protein [Candidatus Poribacteria bacterium]
MHTDPDSIDEQNLPLFPLNVVLFPGGMLPLHIFEQRYREMVKYCIRHESSFGIVMIKDGEESGEAAKPCKIGTVVDLVEVDRFPDGRMNIVTSGHSRFEILEVDNELPYLVGRVRILDAYDMEADKKLEKIASETRQLYIEYESLSSFLRFGWQPPEENPEHPQQLAFQIGSRLRIPNNEKQELLEIISFDELLKREIEILKDFNRQIAFQLAARNN